MIYVQCAPTLLHVLPQAPTQANCLLLLSLHLISSHLSLHLIIFDAFFVASHPISSHRTSDLRRLLRRISPHLISHLISFYHLRRLLRRISSHLTRTCPPPPPLTTCTYLARFYVGTLAMQISETTFELKFGWQSKEQ